jgi:hypothetical protein
LQSRIRISRIFNPEKLIILRGSKNIKGKSDFFTDSAAKNQDAAYIQNSNPALGLKK